MKNKILFLVTLIFISASISSCNHTEIDKSKAADVAAVRAAQPANSTAQSVNDVVIHKSPNDDRSYAAITLPNGLQAVLVSDPSLENSAATLALPIGSVQDPAEFQGLAHYLEHMLFLGTKKYPEPDGLSKFVQLHGGSNNASTYSDKTYYLFQVNSTKFDEALDMFSDYFKSPTFDKTYADKQRHAVDSEWSMQRSQYRWSLWRLNELTANPKNPRSQFSIGNLETLRDKPNSLLQDNVKAFYDRYYSANIMRLTLVGKQSIPELKDLVKKHFSSIVNKNVLAPKITEPGLTNAQLAQHIHFNPTQDVKSLFIDFPVASNREQWRLKPNQYVLNLLASQEKGTLFEQLRRQGLVNDMWAFVEAEYFGSDGFLRVEAELTEKGLAHQDEIIAATFAYIDLIKREGLNERYFQELQASSQKDFLNSNKLNPLDQSVQLAVDQLTLPVEHLLDANFIFERYDETAIKGLLSQLDQRKVRIWSISNKEVTDNDISFFDGKYAQAPISEENFKKWEAAQKNYHFSLPPLNNLFTTEPAPIVDNVISKPKAIVSAPGVEAFLVQPTFYREDKGQLSIEINTPIGQQSAKNIVLANVLVNIFSQQNMSLIDRAARASLEVSLIVSSTNSLGIDISGYTTRHAFIVNELINNFSHFTFTQQEFSSQLDSYIQSIKNKSKMRVSNQMWDHINRMVGKSSKTNTELLAAAKIVSANDLTNFYLSVKKDPLLRIFASGNYSEETLKSIALGSAAILPGHRLPVNRVIKQFDIPQNGNWKLFADSVDLEDSGVLITWFGEKGSDAEWAEMQVLDGLFYPAAYTQLRTNEQLGYIVDGGYSQVADRLCFFMAVQSANSDLIKIKSRIDNFRKTYFETFKSIDEAEIEKIKQAKIANLMQKPTDFNTEASQYAHEFWRARYAFDERDRHIAALKKVDKAALISLYEKLLLNDKSSGAYVQLRGTNFKDASFSSLR